MKFGVMRLRHAFAKGRSASVSDHLGELVERIVLTFVRNAVMNSYAVVRIIVPSTHHLALTGMEKRGGRFVILSVMPST